MNAHIVLCTCPDLATATTIANELVDKQLAACVNILPAVHSIYRWKGQLEASEELLLLIKSSQANYPQLETSILALHPYELPEIIAIPVVAGLASYLAWIESGGSDI